MWSKRVLIEVSDDALLRPAIGELLTQQRATWPALCEGEIALASMPTRVLATGDAALIVQANVRRRGSTFARTDARSIAERPCFLCETHLPPEERAVAFDDLVVMPNPFPAVPEHLTLAAREHVPQRLAGRIDILLRAARALGEDFFVLYNGPTCGASAPDHFHFQAGRRLPMPVFDHSQFDQGTGISVLRAGARAAARVRAATEAEAASMTSRVLAKLAAVDSEPPEPKVNVLATYRHDHFVVLMFPRLRHRPANFFAPDRALAISPAALEMAGLVVIGDEDEFARVAPGDVEAIFDEVCMSESQLQRALARR